MTLNCAGKLIDLTQPKVMGILNATPDSFYDGGRFENHFNALKQVEKMLSEGATFIDIGGYSTRPNAVEITEKEELRRVIPLIEMIVKTFPEVLISIDTFRSKVATEAVKSGAVMINDISGGSFDTKMFDCVADLKVPYILMHIQGTPQNMQQNPVYQNIVKEVNTYFAEKIAILKTKGVNDIIIDPGYGFGKTVEHNFELLQNQSLLGFGDYPILTGISRKSMIYKTLDTTPQEVLNGTTVLNTLALLQKASILRVHDVKEAVECVKLVEKFGR